MAAPNGVRMFHRMADRPKIRTVVMAGTGRGDEIPVMRQLWKNAVLIGVDPLKEHWRIMWRMQQEPDIKIENRALWSESGDTVTFHLNYEPDHRASAYELPQGVPDELTRKIKTISLDDIFAEHGPYTEPALLWLDTEGAEHEILRSCKSLAAFRWINVEMSFLPLRDSPRWQMVDAALESAGFKLQGVHSTSKNGRQTDALYIPTEIWETMRSASERRGIDRKIRRLNQGHGRVARKARRAMKEAGKNVIVSDDRNSGDR